MSDIGSILWCIIMCNPLKNNLFCVLFPREQSQIKILFLRLLNTQITEPVFQTESLYSGISVSIQASILA